jgi:hypothetical protein
MKSVALEYNDLWHCGWRGGAHSGALVNLRLWVVPGKGCDRALPPGARCDSEDARVKRLNGTSFLNSFGEAFDSRNHGIGLDQLLYITSLSSYFPNTNITKVFGTIAGRGFGRSGVAAGGGPN